MTTFGEWLRRSRKSVAKITQKQLAVLAGCSEPYVSMLEGDKPHPTTGKKIHPDEFLVEALARAMKVDINEARQAAGYPALSNESINDDSPIVEYINSSGEVLKSVSPDAEMLRMLAGMNRYLNLYFAATDKRLEELSRSVAMLVEASDKKRA